VRTQVEYFETEGRKHWSSVKKAALDRCTKLGLRKAIVFTGDGVAARDAASEFAKLGVQLIAVSFCAGHSAMTEDGKKVVTTVSQEIREALKARGCLFLQGTRPFEAIVLPDCDDVKLTTLRETLGLFSGGMSLCVEAVLMAADAGLVSPGEDVVAMSGDTAIVARASTKAWLFAPWGLQVREIICKPRSLTLTKREETAITDDKSQEGGGTPPSRP
jgi:hypothetical protein